MYNDRKEACRIERIIIQQNWSNSYCLNEAAGASISLEGLRYGAAKTNKILAKKMQDPNYRKEYREKVRQGLLASPLLERQRELLQSVHEKAFRQHCSLTLGQRGKIPSKRSITNREQE
jgi:hypothetical protein